MGSASTKKGEPGLSFYPVALAVLAAALFGASTPASKVLLGDLSPFQLAGLLYLGAMLGVAPIALRHKSAGAPWRLDGRNRRLLLGAMLFGGIAGPVLLLFGLRLASAASVSMWLNLELVATAILGRAIFRDHLGRFGWIGVIGVLIAGLMLTASEGRAGIAAGLLVAAACLCWGLDNHLTALIDGITPSQSTFWKSAVAGAVNLTIGLSLFEFNGGTVEIAGGLLLGAFAYGVSITFYIAAAQSLGATRSQMIFAAAPFFGVLLAALALGESVSGLQVLAALLLVLSISLIFRDRHSHSHIHPPMAHEHEHRHDDNHHDHEHSGEPDSARHSHWHKHERTTHTHPHWPDLHHRHDHEDDQG